MVQTDISQLTAECDDWRQILRNYREEFQTSKKSLQEICRKSFQKTNSTKSNISTTSFTSSSSTFTILNNPLKPRKKN